MRDSYIYYEHADTVVVGGGPSGIMAAVASARMGAKTILLERYGFLGGNATTGLVGRFWGFFYKDTQIVHGLAEEFLQRLKAAGGLAEPNDFMPVEGGDIDITVRVIAHDSETLKCVADDFVLESGATIIFHAQVTDLIKDGDTVTSIIIETPEGRGKIDTRMVIDCSGDGTLAYLAGGKDMNADISELQPPSMPFRVSNIDMDEFLSLTREEKQSIIKKGIDQGVLTTVVFGGSITPHKGAPGIMHIMMSRIPNINALKTNDLTRGEIDGRKQVSRVMEFLRAEVPGFKQANLMQIAPHLAVRETRRIRGEQLLTDEQAIAGVVPEDTIAFAAGPIDMHNKGTGFSFMQWPERPFGIPYGALLPIGTTNIIMAGRCISAERAANAGVRHMAICMATGHAAGVACGLALKNNLHLKQVPVTAIREVLVEQGAYLG